MIFFGRDTVMIPLLGFCSKKGFTITKKILMSSKMSGFEVLAFKSIPHGRGGVIMIENGLGICRRSQGTHYPPDKAKILNSWSRDQSL